MTKAISAFLLTAFVSLSICDAKLIPRRDPLDGALDATLIVIVNQQSPGLFEVQEVFLGYAVRGQVLSMPDFKLIVEDTSAPIFGVERIEPIYDGTRILVFLKPAGKTPGDANLKSSPNWAVAGFGNCYFWSHDPRKLDSLRSMAASALTLRRSWESARDIPDERQRAEALWPFLWSHNSTCYRRTEAELEKIGPIAGDYIAEQLEKMDYRQKNTFLTTFAAYRSPRLHTALIRELKEQEAAWEALLRRRGSFATFAQVSPPDRIRDYGRPPRHTDADRTDDIYGVLYQGFIGLGNFADPDDLPFIRESAVWAVKYRFKQLDDAALEAFGKMPDKDNLPVIQAIWNQYSLRPFVGNELKPYDVMKALEPHRYPETIPLMAQFVNAGFGQQLARKFLVKMTGVDFDGDTKMWLGWYESHKSSLGVGN